VSRQRDILLTFAFFGFVYCFLARAAFHGFPLSGDEYSHLLQAELFARGLLHSAAPTNSDWFRVDHVVVDDWVRSKYPPGTSALLALGVLLRVPWLVTPVEGVLTLVLVWTATRRVLGEKDARVVVLLLGGAPLFAFQAGSFFSHTATSMWLAAAFAGVSASATRPRPFCLLVAGLALGCAFLTRPLDAVVFGAALLALRSTRVMAFAGLGAAPFVVAHLAYQNAQFGSPWTDGYHAYNASLGPAGEGSMMAPSYVLDREQLAQHLDVVRALVVDWTVPGTALLAFLGYAALRRAGQAEWLRRFALAFMTLEVAVLFVTQGWVDDGARPRYLSPSLLPLACLAGPGWRAGAALLSERVGRAAVQTVGAVAALLAAAQLQSFLSTRAPEVSLREGLYRTVAGRGIRDGIVVVPTPIYARNGPFFDRSVLYVSAPPAKAPEEAAAAFPGRAVFLAREACPREDGRWTLLRIQ